MLIALVVGALIGLTGVGGVLLGPALVGLNDLPPSEAAATASWSFLFTGLVGAWTYARRDSVDWRAVRWLMLGLVPGSIVGAAAASAVPSQVVITAMIVLTVTVGVRQLTGRAPAAAVHPRTVSGRILALVGLAVGVGSAMTGTGGPVLLVPILLLLEVPPLLAVGVGQVIQLPVVAGTTAGFAFSHSTDFMTGTVLGLIAAAGTLLGASVAPRLRTSSLQRVIGVVCIAAGSALGLRLLV